jgi:hypothetical protein
MEHVKDFDEVLSHFHPCLACGNAVECHCPFPDESPIEWTCQGCLDKAKAARLDSAPRAT